MMKSGTVFALAGAFFFTLAASTSPAAAQESEGADSFTVDEELAEKGEELFESKQCFTCHTIGEGVVIGPDLEGVVARRELDWLRDMIRDPVKMTAKDSLAASLKAEASGIQMPNPDLTDEELEALIHYLASEGG